MSGSVASVSLEEVVGSVPQPAGVRLKRIDQGLDHSGDHAVWIIFAASKKVPLTKKRIAVLENFASVVRDRVLEIHSGYLPYVRFVEMK
jgi:hypothetical protein